MERNASINVRIEPDIKAEAEAIFDTIGLSTATAINAFYRQVILRKGLPFSLLAVQPPLSLANMTQAELDTALRQAQGDHLHGRVLSEDELEQRFQRSGRT